jgi:DNA-binding NarL/FixJ family response regulator
MAEPRFGHASHRWVMSPGHRVMPTGHRVAVPKAEERARSPTGTDLASWASVVPTEPGTTVADLWREIGGGCVTAVHRVDSSLERALVVERSNRRRLSPRERLVFELASSGEAMKAIAYVIGVTDATAKSYFASARTTTGFQSRQELIFWANRVTSGVASISRVDAQWILSAPPPTVAADRLSEAEVAVITQAASGLSNADIAARRHVSVRTVANQLGAAFRKLGVGSRFELGSLLARSIPLPGTGMYGPVPELDGNGRRWAGRAAARRWSPSRPRRRLVSAQ